MDETLDFEEAGRILKDIYLLPDEELARAISLFAIARDRCARSGDAERAEGYSGLLIQAVEERFRRRRLLAHARREISGAVAFWG